jgi:predicted aspartyl protease
MSFSFQSRQGPILVQAEVTGPSRSLSLELILDTGATTTVLNETVVTALGYDLTTVTTRSQMTTGSTITTVPRVALTRMSALGVHRLGFPVLAYSLPSATSVMGLLGLDFVRDRVLTIDFLNGLIDLKP